MKKKRRFKITFTGCDGVTEVIWKESDGSTVEFVQPFEWSTNLTGPQMVERTFRFSVKIEEA